MYSCTYYTCRYIYDIPILVVIKSKLLVFHKTKTTANGQLIFKHAIG